MHKLYLLIVALFATTFLYAQEANISEQNDESNNPSWTDMMQDPEVNFYNVQQAFNQYFVNRERSKGDGWKPFKRWEWYMEQRINADGTRPSPTHVMDEYSKFIKLYGNTKQKSTSGTWSELGPINMPTNGTGQPNGLGRVNAVAFHPTNANIMYIAAPSGGIWKTTNGGTTWIPLTDTLPTLGASSLLIHPTSTNTLYLGSGDRDGGDAPGMGVLKSTDGGTTWAFANTGMGNKVVGDMLMHPTNSNIIIAATSGGIYRTTNGGSSWTLASTSTSHFKDLEFKPNDPNTVYAVAGTSFYKSTNNGVSWSTVTSGLPGGSGRYVIGVSAASASTVYVLAGGSNGLVGCYRSTNSGASFTSQSTSPNILGYSETGSDTKSQAWYDLAIAVDPSNANTVYVGGINIWKSTNGGSSWALNAHWVGSGNTPEVHADIHSLDFSPVNSRLYCGNDGGLYYTTNGGTTWPEISSGLAISQIYKIGQSATSKNLVINGYQDNGTAIYNNGSWTTEIGGDGMECLIDYTNTNYVYGSLYYGDIRRSTNGGTSFDQIAGDQVNGITEEGGWVTPFILDVTNTNKMTIGFKNLWRSSNVKTSNASSVSWTKLTNSLGGSNSYNIKVIEQSESNANILYFSRADDALFRSDNYSNTTPTFTDLSSSLPISGYYPSDIEAHPSIQNTVYITIHNDVYKSTNKGSTWTNISGNLPNISMNCIVIDTSSTNDALYVGTDAGVYYKDNSLSNWVLYIDGMPAAAEVTELEIYYNANSSLSSIVAATYGRGLWQSELYSSGAALPLADFGYNDEVICTGDTIWFTDSTLFSPTTWSWSFNPSTVTYVSGTSSSSQNPIVKFNAAGYYAVSLTATNANGSNTKTISNLIKAGGYQAPFLEEFEANSVTLGDWTVGNSDNSTTWAIAATAGNGTSARSVYMNNYNYTTTGQRDNLYSPILNLEGLSTASLKYKHAYTRYTAYPSDSLIIYVSNNCGDTWTKIASYGESGTGNFATAPNTTYASGSNFVPNTASDWCGAGVGASCDSIDLTAYAGDDDVRLVFQAYNNYSNNLYLDDINVSGSASTTLSASFTSSTTSPCTGVQVNFTNTSLNATSYVWKQNGSTISTTSNLSKTFTTSGTYEIRLVASDGTSLDSVSQTIIVNPTAGMAATPSGPSTICSNASNSTYTTSGATNANSYAWSISPTSAGTISGTSTTGTVNWNSAFAGTATIQVMGSNACGNGTISTAASTIVSAAPNAASAPTGTTSLCVNPSNTSYTTTSITNATSYTWTLSPSSAGVITGSTNTISIDWNNTFTGNVTLTVQGSNTCGNGTTSPGLAITINQTPGTATMPTGPTNLCKNPSNTSYSVSSVATASSYFWTINPTSAGSISGTGLSATVNWDGTFIGTAMISVTGVNSCGTGTASSALNVIVNDNPPVPTITKSMDTLFSSSSTGNQWYNPSGIISGATGQYFVAPANGIYYVITTNASGCSSQSANFTMTGVGISTPSLDNMISIFPNPAKDKVMIDYSGKEELSLSFRNVLGQEIQTMTIDTKTEIDLNQVSSGIYFIVLHEKGNPNSTLTRKLVIYKD